MFSVVCLVSFAVSVWDECGSRSLPPPTARRGRRLRVGADALFVDSVVGVTQQNVGEAGLQQVHGEEGRLLHDLGWEDHKKQTEEMNRTKIKQGTTEK